MGTKPIPIPNLSASLAIPDPTLPYPTTKVEYPILAPNIASSTRYFVEYPTYI